MFSTISREAPRFYCNSAPGRGRTKIDTARSTLDLLKTPDECDALIARINAERDGLDYKKTLLLHDVKEMTKSSGDVTKSLAKVNAKITASETIIAVLADETDKTKESLKKRRLEVQRDSLLNRQSSSNAVALLDVEFDLDGLNARLDTITQKPGEIATRKTEILNQEGS